MDSVFLVEAASEMLGGGAQSLVGGRDAERRFGLGWLFVRQIGSTCRSFTRFHFCFFYVIFCYGHTLHIVGWQK